MYLNFKITLQDAIQGLGSLKISTWSVVLMEMLAYIILIGRLLHDSVTQKVLTQQMIGFLTNASDIFELFSLFEETKVIEDSKATLFVLIFWTISLLQFIPIWGSHNLGTTETEHRKQKSDDKKHYMFFCFCVCDTCNDIDDGEDSTEKYETGIAWVFQDGPFLALRVYLMTNLNLYTESMIFYTLKNITLTILLIVKYKRTALFFFIWGIVFTGCIFLLGYLDLERAGLG